MINEDFNILDGGGGLNSENFQIHPYYQLTIE